MALRALKDVCERPWKTKLVRKTKRFPGVMAREVVEKVLKTETNNYFNSKK